MRIHTFKTKLPFFLISFILLYGSIYAQSIDTTQVSLISILKENSYSINVDNDKITGNGADYLLKEAQEAEVFMFGENHGVKEIARLSKVIYDKLSKEKARLLVTEIGPATASEVEEMIRANAFEKFMNEGANLLSVPFFFLEQEVPLLYSVTDNFPEGKSSVWGLDQEFLAGAPVVLKRLEKLAKTKGEKKVIKQAYRRDFFNPFMIGMGDGNILIDLEEAFSKSHNKEAKRITEQLVESHEIYKANSDGRGRWSNETRETLMMKNFEWYVSNYSDSVPPLYFRFGGYHLHKGSSPTVKEALGLRIDQWAKQKGWNTVNVFVDAAEGQTLDPLFGTKIELPTSKLWNGSIFKQHIINEQATLFNLRVLRNHPETKSMNNKLRHMINGYDYLILLPNGEAQNFLPGTLTTYAYGIPILIVIILVLLGIIYAIVKLVKRHKKRIKRNLTMQS